MSHGADPKSGEANSRECEKAKLKRLLANTLLDQAALKDILTKTLTPAAKRKLVVRLSLVWQL